MGLHISAATVWTTVSGGREHGRQVVGKQQSIVWVSKINNLDFNFVLVSSPIK